MNDVRELKDTIKLIRKENLEEILYFWIDTHSIFWNSLIKYGKDNAITKRSLEIFKEFLEVVKCEEKVMKAFFKQRKNIFIPEALEILDNIDGLHEDTYYFFREMINDLNDAYEMNQEYRLKVPKKNFKMINETNIYFEEATRVLLGFRPMEDFFGFPLDYWNYIDSALLVLDDDLEDVMDFIGVYYKLDKKGNVIKIKLVVPRIVNLKTLLINVWENYNAYLLYKNLNKKFNYIDYEFTNEVESDFISRKFLPTYQKYFK